MPFRSALGQLQEWKRQGREMPGYNYGWGSTYLAYLLGFYDGPQDSIKQQDIVDLNLNLLNNHRALLEALPGPYGWAILKILIVKKGLLNDEQKGRTETTA